MESSVLLLSALAVLPSKLLEENYRLASKLFVSRNFDKLYSVAQTVYDQVIQEYPRGVVDEQMLIKSIELYIGIITTIASESPVFTPSPDLNQVISDVERLFGNKRNVPPKLLYTYYLACKSSKVPLLITLELSLIISTFQFGRDSEDEKKMAQFYVELLVEQNRWDEAKQFIGGCPVFTTADLDKVDDYKQVQEDVRKKDQLARQRQEDEQKQRKVDQLKQLRERQLEYVKLNEMRLVPTPALAPNAVLLKQRVLYVYLLVRRYISENSLVVGVVVLLVAVSLPFVKINRATLNVMKDRVVETVKMAMKVTYM